MPNDLKLVRRAYIKKLVNRLGLKIANDAFDTLDYQVLKIVSDAVVWAWATKRRVVQSYHMAQGRDRVTKSMYERMADERKNRL